MGNSGKMLRRRPVFEGGTAFLAGSDLQRPPRPVYHPASEEQCQAAPTNSVPSSSGEPGMATHSGLDRVDQLSAALEAAIVGGEWETGQRLPAEPELAARFEVGRADLRQALARITTRGLVVPASGRGFRVLSAGDRQVTQGYQALLQAEPARLEDLAVVRLVLETAIAAAAARQRTPTHLRALAKQQEILFNPRRSLAAHVRADGEFHRLLAQATGNSVYPLVLAPIQHRLTESRLQTLQSFGAQIAHMHHQRILDAVRDRDEQEAAAAMSQHLQVNQRHLEQLEETRGGPDLGDPAPPPTRPSRRPRPAR